MAAGTFKKSVELVAEGASPRLLDHATKHTFPLSLTEAGLLRWVDGKRSLEDLAEQALQNNLAITSAEISELLHRVSRAGFLLAANAPPQSNDPRVPSVLSDKVPRFRPDLRIEQRPDSRSVVTVTDPVNGKTFSLYDFELSVARMLDGKRTVIELTEAAGRIGIPVTLESLKSFVRQMQAYGFLALETAEVPATSGHTWPDRRTWHPEVRELFQSALRLSRAGKLGEAKEYLQALLLIDAGNEEALALQERLTQQTPSDEVGVDFDDMHGAADAAPAPADEALALDPPSAQEGEAAAVGNEGAPAAGVARRGKRLAMVVGGALVLALWVPLPDRARIPCTLSRVVLGVPRTAREGVLAAQDAPSRSRVTAQQPVGTLSRAALDAQLTDLDARLATARAKLQAERKRPKAPQWPKLKKSVDALQKQLDAALAKKAALDRAHLVPGKLAVEGAKAQKVIDQKKAALAKAQSALDKAGRTSEIAAAQAAQDKLTAESDALKAQLPTFQILAPVAGVFVAPAQGIGAAFDAGVPYGFIARPDAVALLPEGDPSALASAKEAALTLSDAPSKRWALREFQAARAAIPGDALGAATDIPDAEAVDGKAAIVDVEVGLRPAGLVLLHRLSRR